MSITPKFEDLRMRIESDIAHFKGALPESFTIAWSGYLAALIEWGLVSVSDHQKLCALLPSIKDDPSITILLGRPD